MKKLVAATVELDGTKVTVTGDSSNEDLTVTKKSDTEIWVGSTAHSLGIEVDLIGDLVIKGMSGSDTIGYSHNGFDSLVNVSLIGGDGNDTIQGSQFGSGKDEFISGDDQYDSILGHGGDDTITGGDGRDTIHGGDGKDVINGGNDRDTIFGGSGDDSIHGNGDVDFIDGGGDDDEIFGDDGNDCLIGGNGEDTMMGGNGKDVLKGDADHDKLCGEAGVDTLHGGAGDDWLVGGGDNDFCYGEGGNDLIWGDKAGVELDGVNTPHSDPGSTNGLGGVQIDDEFNDASTGAAYIFELDGNLVTRVSDPEPNPGNWFGWSSGSINNNEQFIVGSVFNSTGEHRAGKAFVVDPSGEIVATLSSPESGGQQFGVAFATIDDMVLVGEPQNDGGFPVGFGAALAVRPSRAGRFQ